MTRKMADHAIQQKTANDLGPVKWMAPEAFDRKYSRKHFIHSLTPLGYKSDAWSFGISML